MRGTCSWSALLLQISETNFLHWLQSAQVSRLGLCGPETSPWSAGALFLPCFGYCHVTGDSLPYNSLVHANVLSEKPVLLPSCNAPRGHHVGLCRSSTAADNCLQEWEDMYIYRWPAFRNLQQGPSPIQLSCRFIQYPCPRKCPE